MSSFRNLQISIRDLRNELINHQLYDRLNTQEALLVFLEHHVFAVWDFMSLLKSLQRKLTCIEVPWRPPASSSACRLINEIVLAEESDIGPTGEPASHFELYCAAMTDAGANTEPIEKFLHALRNGASWRDAMRTAPMSQHVKDFVETTFDIIDTDDVCGIASAFTFGREDLLPQVFAQIIRRLNAESAGSLDGFEYYLQRHIELDGDEHGAMAQRLVEELCGDDHVRWQTAEAAAVRSLLARKRLWDGIADEIETKTYQTFLPGLS